ncbi:MAG: glycoside hydrolase family 5 protein [Bacteroidota bacterium]
MIIAMNGALSMLKVNGGRIVDADNQPVRLRGVCIGGWMNMENFINGYPGAEYTLRAAMARELGPAKASFFFDRMLDYFLAEDDLRFIKGCGATAVRLPLNYRHFEADAQPFMYLETGFARLQRVVDWCAGLGLYVILDLHAAQGWQSTDWHCDNAHCQALFWEHPHFQDRFVALWEEFARRFKDNAAIAGYNIMNEPVCNAHGGRYVYETARDWDKMNRIYRRVVTAIRALDPAHIIFLEGDNFATLFEGLEAPFAPNLVYSSHNYNPAGVGHGRYPGTINGEWWDRRRQRAKFQEHPGTQFAVKHNVPLYVGEFGASANGLSRQRPCRLRALDDQIDVFEEHGVHWTTWTYKDVGVMSWVRLDPESEYLKLIAPVLKAKIFLHTDSGACWLPPTRPLGVVRGLGRLVAKTAGYTDVNPKANEYYLKRLLLDGYAGSMLQPLYAGKFKGMTETEIDRILQSFAFKNCRPYDGLVEVVRKHMGRPV